MSSRANQAQVFYDNALMGILQHAGKIEPFLDGVFSFLYRQTDFFQYSTPDGKYGLPPGQAEIIVRDTFRHFLKLAEEDREKKAAKPLRAKPVEEPRPAPENSTMDTTPEATLPKMEKATTAPTIEESAPEDPERGAVHDTFSWTQGIGDVEVKVHVPKMVKAAQLHVEMKKTSVCIKLDGQMLFEGTLTKEIKPNSETTTWCVEAGSGYVHLALEKEKEGWWDSLIEGEDKIDVTKLKTDPLDFTQLGQEEQQLIRKMTYEEELKLQGKATSEQIKQVQQLLQIHKNGGKNSPFGPGPLDWTKISGCENVKPSDLVD